MLSKTALAIFCVIAAISRLATSYHEKSSEELWQEITTKILLYVAENSNAAKKRDIRTQCNRLNDYGYNRISKPTSVHKLRPQDVDVVGALGDSLTTANGANGTTVYDIITKYLGLSFSAGGDADVHTITTFPNLLRIYNPNLKGYSLGRDSAPGEDRGFNVAIPGARAKNIPFQARLLIDKMKESKEIDFDNDWKVITVFIGGNDLCALDWSENSQPEKYIEFIKEGLDILHAEMKRTLVNLVTILQISPLPKVAFGFGSTEACRAVQKLECDYVVDATNEEMQEIKVKNTLYQILTANLVKSGRYDTRDDFTVVLQPFLTDSTPPLTEDGEIDATYFAPDCFHFGTKLHALAGLNLWNNMMEPVGQKATKWSISPPKEPNEEKPYFYTNLNSPSTAYKQSRKLC